MVFDEEDEDKFVDGVGVVHVGQVIQINLNPPARMIIEFPLEKYSTCSKRRSQSRVHGVLVRIPSLQPSQLQLPW